MTEIKDRIEELNKALKQEISNLQKLEEITNETKSKIVSIRGGVAELSRIQGIFDKVQKEFDEAPDKESDEEGVDNEEE